MYISVLSFLVSFFFKFVSIISGSLYSKSCILFMPVSNVTPLIMYVPNASETI